QRTPELHVRQKVLARGDQHVIDIGVRLHHRCRGRFNEVGEMCVRKRAPQRRNGRRREDDGANRSEPDNQDSWCRGQWPRCQVYGFSIVASSINMTGMSSLIGYTRLQVSHLRAVPFLMRLTGVLQLGHTRISSSSGSMAMAGK